MGSGQVEEREQHERHWRFLGRAPNNGTVMESRVRLFVRLRD
jgi:hypothetical protein